MDGLILSFVCFFNSLNIGFNTPILLMAVVIFDQISRLMAYRLSRSQRTCTKHSTLMRGT